MKHSAFIIITLVLTALVFSGCRRNTQEPMTDPTVMPTAAPTTVPTTRPTTAPTTRPTTAPTTLPTNPMTEETIEGGLGDTAESTESSGGKSRRAMPRGF